MLDLFFGVIIYEEFDHLLLLSHSILLFLNLVEYALLFLLLSDIPKRKFEFVIDFEDLVNVLRGL
jgi:hypothetical protein